MRRFDLVTVDVSAADIRRRMRQTDMDSPPSEEELHALTELTFKFVPTAKALEDFAYCIAGEPGVN